MTKEIVRIGPALAVALALGLAGCNSSPTINSINNSLATLANNDLPAACGIVAVAEGYFAQLKSGISAKNIATEAKAAAAVDAICSGPPPANLAAAFQSLFAAWMAVQNATKATP